MHIGICLPPEPLDAVALRALLGAADGLGYHSVWVPCAPGDGGFDPLAVVGVVVGATRRVRVATDAMVAMPRAHGQAKTLEVLHELSDHRLALGLRGTGAGWEGAGWELVGELAHHLRDAFVAGVRPSVLMHGDGADVMEFVAHRADGWIADRDDVTWIRRHWADIQRRAEAAGRDPAELRLLARTAVREGCRVPVLRSLEAAGVHEVILDTAGVGTLDQVLQACAAVAEELALDRT